VAGNLSGTEPCEILRPDATLPALAQGQAWMPALRRPGPHPPGGTPAVIVHGPEAVRFFYEDEHIRRRSALPGPVLDTLFGRGAVQTLDGRHRTRKALFVRRPSHRGRSCWITGCRRRICPSGPRIPARPAEGFLLAPRQPADAAGARTDRVPAASSWPAGAGGYGRVRGGALEAVSGS
jgi:hypothetical protein